MDTGPAIVCQKIISRCYRTSAYVQNILQNPCSEVLYNSFRCNAFYTHPVRHLPALSTLVTINDLLSSLEHGGTSVLSNILSHLWTHLFIDIVLWYWTNKLKFYAWNHDVVNIQISEYTTWMNKWINELMNEKVDGYMCKRNQNKSNNNSKRTN